MQARRHRCAKVARQEQRCRTSNIKAPQGHCEAHGRIGLVKWEAFRGEQHGSRHQGPQGHCQRRQRRDGAGQRVGVAALVNYSVAVAKAVAGRNVMINNILPGMHHTAAIEERYNALAKANGTTYEEEIQKFIDAWRIPANRFGDPEDLGAFVALFCSEQAGFLTGQSLVIDGGQTNATF